MSARLRAAFALATLLCAFPRGHAAAQKVVFAASVITELDSATQAALTHEVGLARSRGLPVEPLLAKVREGQIKRAPAARIRTAVSALAIRLDSARSALGVGSSKAELVAGADALAAGADGSALRSVRSASGARDVAAPLGALAQLVATGVPTRRATQLIVDLLRHDAAPGQVLAFGNAVEADVGAGLPAEEAALFRFRAIESTRITTDQATALSGGFQNGGVGAAAGPPNTGDRSPPRRRP